MQNAMRNLECHAKARYALGAAMWIAATFLQCNSPVDSGAVTTS